jgi:hypothetical protein
MYYNDYESGDYSECCKYDKPYCGGISGYYNPLYGGFYGSKYSSGYGYHTRCIGGYRYPWQ